MSISPEALHRANDHISALERELAEARAQIERKDKEINRAGAFLSQGLVNPAIDKLKEALATPATHPFREVSPIIDKCGECGKHPDHPIHNPAPAPEPSECTKCEGTGNKVTTYLGHDSAPAIDDIDAGGCERCGGTGREPSTGESETDFWEKEFRQLQQAVLDYATLAPLDLLSLSETQNDLIALSNQKPPPSQQQEQEE